MRIQKREISEILVHPMKKKEITQEIEIIRGMKFQNVKSPTLLLKRKCLYFPVHVCMCAIFFFFICLL